MEREISFRVKRLDNGEFIEGSLTVDCHGNCCIYHPLNVPIGGGFQYFDVDKETVGQFTGMTDKNGTKIFEGDIVVNKNIHGKKWIVEYRTDSEYVGFVLKEIGTNGISLFTSWNDIEVIGNIYDNKELLK